MPSAGWKQQAWMRPLRLPRLQRDAVGRMKPRRMDAPKFDCREATVPERGGPHGGKHSHRIPGPSANSVRVHPGPLPNPTASCNAVEEIVIDRLGRSWTQATACGSAHLGSRPSENSGVDDLWVGQPHARTFSNQCSINVMAVGRTREQVASASFSGCAQTTGFLVR